MIGVRLRVADGSDDSSSYSWSLREKSRSAEQGIDLLADWDADLHVDDADSSRRKASFGASLATTASQTFAQVSETSSMMILAAAVGIGSLQRRDVTRRD
jgi:hypothetical protein